MTSATRKSLWILYCRERGRGREGERGRGGEGERGRGREGERGRGGEGEGEREGEREREGGRERGRGGEGGRERGRGGEGGRGRGRKGEGERGRGREGEREGEGGGEGGSRVEQSIYMYMYFLTCGNHNKQFEMKTKQKTIHTENTYINYCIYIHTCMCTIHMHFDPILRCHALLHLAFLSRNILYLLVSQYITSSV